MSGSKIGQTLAKLLGIKLQYRNELGKDDVTRGESMYSVSSADTFVEREPTAVEWLRNIIPSGHGLLLYVYHLFPFTHWITRYNVQWLYGDLVAGITVGCVVVPQSMAYAGLANLAPEFGLYSSFMGVLIYWFFATSKDITIGPVAVLSTVTGNVVNKVHAKNPKFPKNEIASALAVIGGSVVLFMGLVRCGWIVEFISLAAISAFMTGSAINIAAGQVPTMMGITGFSTREATYKVIINTLKHLGRTKIDAAMGLTALTMLYLIRFICNTAAKKQPNRKKFWFFISTLRTSFVILLYVMISWLVNRHHRKKPIFKILGNVPRGFKHAQVPVISKRMVKGFASELPATIIVLLIEHIAIAKSFGRVNNYTINPSQELVAIGVTNVLGPFLGAYPATGSFSRTAIKSKAGVRTPFAGVITAVVVLLAIYALPAVFFYIPSASLSAVIIHAVGDLITPPNTVYQFWRVSPLEVFIFFAGVIVTIFSSIENGIYTTISVSAAMLLFRVVKARGRFLGRVKAHSVVGDHILDNNRGSGGKYGGVGQDAPNDPDVSTRNIFLPIDHRDGSNPSVDITAPYPGIFIYRFSEGYNYPNANHYLDYLVETIFQNTRRTNPNTYGKLGDRPWNDPGPRRGQLLEINENLPTLKAIILDFSSVNNVDVTSVQLLIDIRNQLDRYASPDTVDWHIACINNRWTKRALAAAGFGFPTPSQPGIERWKPVFSVAEIGGPNSAAANAEARENELARKRFSDPEFGQKEVIDGITHHSTSSSDKDFTKDISTAKAYGVQKSVVLHGINRPLFHLDLTSALQSAIHNVERREHSEAKGVGTDDKFA
ncbi:MAG: Sulfate permease 2 [Candelina mexicana]|nr:MAG: Sulfate permease 2 [Candelina mexicana]